MVEAVRGRGMRPSAGLHAIVVRAAGAELALMASRRPARGNRPSTIAERPPVGRNTLLWALASDDAQVATALQQATVGASDLARMIGLSAPVARTPTVIDIDSDLEVALATYLQTRTAGDTIGPVQVARAVLEDIDARRRGERPRRSDELDLDPRPALAWLAGLDGPDVTRSGASDHAEEPGPDTVPLVRMADLDPARFGVHVPAGLVDLPEYVPRDADVALREALQGQARNILVRAEPGSGAFRSTFEVMRSSLGDEAVVLLVPELLQRPDLGEEGLDALLTSDARVVWVGHLREAHERAPYLSEWFARRGESVAAPVVALLREGDETLAAGLGLEGQVVTGYAAVLTDAERSRAQALLGRPITRVSGLAPQDLVRPARARAGISPDSFEAAGLLDTTTDDLLIADDVEMLARLVASRDVQAPLSIGLFGAWGSGKSFLMHQMRLQIQELADASRAADDGASGYFAEIVPIEFNAWQYAHDSELWASLINRVFEGITEYLGDDRYRTVLDEIEQTHAEVTAAQTVLDAAEQQMRRTATSKGDRTVADVTVQHPELAATAQAVTSGLDVSAIETRLSDVRSEVGELQKAGGRLRRGWADASGLRRAAVLAVGAVGLAGAVAALVLGQESLARYATLTVSVLVPVLTVTLALLRPVRHLVRACEALLQTDQQDKRDYEDALKRRDDAVERLETLGRGRLARLHGFVRERFSSEDYREHLGMAPIIRQDLKRLAAMAKGEGPRSPSTGQDAASQGIDRVVIFIDDLDRCPADEVVRVLEAVNLLFGFPLFVVVVAVDSRWLVRSLESQFSEVFDDADDAAPTPRNYLEKIIQIPFWLRPMSADGFGRLVTTLAGPPVERTQREPSPFHEPVVEHDDDRRDESADDRREELAPDTAPMPGAESDQAGEQPEKPDREAGRPPEPSSPARPPIDLKPAALRLTRDEVELMKDLSTLVRTPRATKRFLNTYQLIRVSVDDIEDFLDHDCQPVLVLLALMTGTCPLDDAMVSQLLDMRQGHLGVLLEDPPEPWREVATACQGLPLEALTPDFVRTWLPRVARYTFHPIET